ncbi:MAG: ABC transporter ATP-binding protein [Clostridiales bacterium]|nr:ABC transporter ATP-binding protein [Clostridiales bacterium]
MIQVSQVDKIYNPKKSNAFQALKQVSLRIEDGEFVAIMGKSGAGKSTLMHVLGCIDSFESGSVTIDGVALAHADDRTKAALRNEKIGIVLQDFALVSEFSVLENVMIPLSFARGKKNRRALAKKALEKAGIAELAGKNVNQLSGGQKQRVAIARAIANEPAYILADEPTGSLDSKTADDIMKLLAELNASGITVIVITHDVQVARCSRRVIQIQDGCIIQDEAVS